MELIFGVFGNPIVQATLKILVFLFLMVLPLAAILTLMERKWSALIQDRIGPNRAAVGSFSLRGVFHIVADGIKSAFKEDTIPQGTNLIFFVLAPFLGFISVFVIFALIPIADPIGDFRFQITDADSAILILFAFTSLGVYGSVLAGWSTSSKFGLLGSLRASAQMISYEVFLGLSVIGIFLVFDSFRMAEIVAGQNTYWLGGWIPKWGIFVQPVGFVLFLIAMIAETKRAPFDAPEGESEIVAGYFIEYSGMRFASFFLAEYIAVVAVSALVTTLFLGSYHIPWLHTDGFHFGGLLFIPLPTWLITILQIGAFTTKVIMLCWLQLMIRWSNPRFRFDQTMKLGWNKLLPLGLANLVITIVVILLIES